MAQVVDFFEERREYPRLDVRLPGRYMLEDGSEFPGETLNVSRVGVVIRGARSGRIGERVIAYIDDLGRIEGVVVRVFAGHFALDFRAGQNKLERLAQKIEWLAARAAEEFSDVAHVERLDEARRKIAGQA